MTVVVPNVPTPVPSRADPVNFAARADAYHEALPVVVDWMNAQNAENNQINASVIDLKNQTQSIKDAAVVDTTAIKNLAQASANSAAESAASSAASANAPVFSGTTAYVAGAVVYSTVSKSSYRRLSAGTSATDPSADTANWEPVGASLVALPFRIPMAGSNGRLDASWYAAMQPNALLNDIGIPGTAGYGVGICPNLPAGFSPLRGTTDPMSANYGNYIYSDGSIMCWIPAHYVRIGHVNNPTYTVYGVNSVHTKPLSAFPSEAEANLDGYYLPTAFVNAGVNQLGVFRDKYDCSANGSVASSLPLAIPMVSSPAAGQVGFNAVGATNAFHGAIVAAKTRGTKFFPETVFIADMLSRLSEAHAQASRSTVFCAWYDSTGVRNYPKGNDNNGLKSEADVLQYGSANAVTFTSAGASSYPNMALTGSGSVFARTTHNGQSCGVSDIAGNISKINPGLTCIAAAKAITAISGSNPAQVTVVSHNYSTGQSLQIDSVVGSTQVNGKIFKITVTGTDTFTLDGVDGATLTTYVSGGTCTTGTFYLLKPSVDVAAVTSGTTLSTDHWGATGVAAQFDAVSLNFNTSYPANQYLQRFGNAANQVFAWDSLASRRLSMAGLPAIGGVSVPGSNLMGLDYFYQYFRDQLCVYSRGYWGNGSVAGSRYRNLAFSRSIAGDNVGFAASRYL